MLDSKESSTEHVSVKLQRNRQLRYLNRQFQHTQKGFTLIELLIVVAIIGVLAAVAMASYRNYILRSELTETAAKLGRFSRGFELWKQVHGRYPNDSHLVLPPDAVGLAINQADWTQETVLGGNWNWEGPNGYPYAGISIDGPTATEEEIIQFDFIIDDGDLSSGKFRKTPNGRYTFIIDE
ncbi:type IV pilin protein [Aliiglaciecola sp. M165]|uniref:type IV pilin protein n=1 Tax=Aliiglaciecola sp. M165 TaxID=2593649 RepID=UPI00391ADFD3